MNGLSSRPQRWRRSIRAFAKTLKGARLWRGMRTDGRAAHMHGLSRDRWQSCCRTLRERKGGYILPESTHLHGPDGCREHFNQAIAWRARSTRRCDEVDLRSEFGIRSQSLTARLTKIGCLSKSSE